MIFNGGVHNASFQADTRGFNCMAVQMCNCEGTAEVQRIPPFIAINNVFCHISVTLFWARFLCVCFKKWLFRTPAFIAIFYLVLFSYFFLFSFFLFG